jgi:hypothetical protein
MDWDGPDDDEDVYGGVAQALADPAGTYADENGAVPDETPQIKDGAPSTVQQQQDTNKDADQEANYIAGNGQPAQERNELDTLDQGGLPREGISQPEAIPTEEPGDEGDSDTAALAGTQTYKAPPPLTYQPYADHSADEQAMVTQKASENPANFKPSVGRRIAASVAGALSGFGSHNASEGLNVAEKVTGAPLEAARRQWAAQEAPLQQKLQADKAADQTVDRTNAQATNVYNAQERNMTNQARVDSWNALAQQRKAQAQAKLNTVDKNTLGPVDPKNPFGEWQGKTPSGQVVRGLEPPASIQKDPRYVAMQRRQNLSDMAQSGVKLSPQESKYYLINGKLAEPTTHVSISNPSEESERFHAWQTAFKQQNRRAPNADELQQYHFKETAAQPDIKPNLAKSIKDRKDKSMSDAQTAHTAAVVGAKTPEDVAAAHQQYEKDLQDAQDKYESDIETQTHDSAGHSTVSVDDKGNPVFKDASGNVMGPAGGPPASQQPAQQAPPPQQQQVAIQNGNGQKLTDMNLAKQYLAKAGGDKNKARQLAAQDKWTF